MQLTTDSRKVLLIDLQTNTHELKSITGLHKYIGGVGLGIKLQQLYKDQQPLIFAIGPLNGFFPYISKTAIVFENAPHIEDVYIGGSLSTKLRFTGADAIVLLNKAQQTTTLEIVNSNVEFHDESIDIKKLGLPGKRCVLNAGILDNYFCTPQDILKGKLNEKNVASIVITGTEAFEVKDFEKYNDLYNEILSKVDKISINPSNKPSCSNCPMGCEDSKQGEIGGNVLLHSLVGCKYAESLYADLGLVFSCLNCLGYNYTHEDLENLPKYIEEVMHEIHKESL